MDRLEDLACRLGLTLRAQDRCLPVAFRREDHGLLLTLGRQDLRLLEALGGEDRGALVPLGPHLLLHRLLDRPRRVDRLQLDAVDAQTPPLGRLVEHDAKVGVDLVARRQRLLERERADHVAQRRHRQLLDRRQELRNLVGGAERVGDREIEDRVDRDRHVVLRDHRLRRERDDLLAQVDERPQAVDEREEEVKAGVEGAVVAPQPLDDARVRLGDDPNRARERNEDNQDENGADADGEDVAVAHGGDSIRRPRRT